MKANDTATLLMVLAATILAGCGRAPQPPLEVAPAVAGNLQVINRSSLDMDIFLVRQNGQRNRLGLAPASRTTGFALTPAQVAGVGPVSFDAVPLLGSGRTVSTDQVNVTAKETITLNIPPQ
jgi:hypothetical protein